jgi:hypothetical protein
MESSAYLELTPCDIAGVIDGNKYKELKLTPSQQSQLAFAVSQANALTATKTLSNAYVFKFPKGVSGTMMNYKAGGVGVAIKGTDGKIVAHGSLYEMKNLAAVTQAMSVMALVSGQYFLIRINNEMRGLNQKMDTIVGFLYGDKKAELLSEIGFVKYANANFASIMEHEPQKIATITSLQTSKKIAMKDIEFYLNDLYSTAEHTTNSYSDFETITKKAFKIRQSLDLAMQLYAMSGIMEVYYAQNTDSEYIGFLRTEMMAFIDKCDKQILGAFSQLKGKHASFKPTAIKKFNPTPLGDALAQIIENLDTGEKSKMRKVVDYALNSISTESEYYVTENGNLYFTY